MIRVRFNLGAGPRYKKWKIEWPDKGVEYLEPAHVSLQMRGCVLRNRAASARKIFEGHSKFVCAWIECESITITDPVTVDGPQVKYNPRVSPNWELAGSNVDGSQFNQLITNGRSVFIL
jgi:hypothetical protein